MSHHHTQVCLGGTLSPRPGDNQIASAGARGAGGLQTAGHTCSQRAGLGSLQGRITCLPHQLPGCQWQGILEALCLAGSDPQEVKRGENTCKERASGRDEAECKHPRQPDGARGAARSQGHGCFEPPPPPTPSPPVNLPGRTKRAIGKGRHTTRKF